MTPKGRITWENIMAKHEKVNKAKNRIKDKNRKLEGLLGQQDSGIIKNQRLDINVGHHR